MKPELLKVNTSPVQSFSVRRDLVPQMNNKWHYHPEVELIHFKKGEGTQFIGDNIKTFKDGDIVLVGAHLPHYWRYDDAYLNEVKSKPADTRVAHFCENFLGEYFMNLPENKTIKLLLERSKRGLQINGKIKPKVAFLLEKMQEEKETKKIILLLEALFLIANCNQTTSLSSVGFKLDYEDNESLRINAIYDFTLVNFRRKISLDEIAKVALISPNSFCRYFKSKTRKTYSKFLIEIRVGHACKLLMENKLNIKQLCYESGFNNLATFHKYFKLTTKKSPLNYQREFIKKHNS